MAPVAAISSYLNFSILSFQKDKDHLCGSWATPSSDTNSVTMILDMMSSIGGGNGGKFSKTAATVLNKNDRVSGACGPPRPASCQGISSTTGADAPGPKTPRH